MNGLKSNRKESDLYAPVLQWLNLQSKTFAFRTGNHAVFDPVRKIYRKKSQRDLGLADIVGVKNGRAFAFELKKAGGKATHFQVRWLGNFARAGGISYVVDSLEDVQAGWAEI